MRLWRERAAFSALLGRLGGMAKVYRRGWARDGNREVESLKLIGCYKCLLPAGEHPDGRGTGGGEYKHRAALPAGGGGYPAGRPGGGLPERGG